MKVNTKGKVDHYCCKDFKEDIDMNIVWDTDSKRFTMCWAAGHTLKEDEEKDDMVGAWWERENNHASYVSLAFCVYCKEDIEYITPLKELEQAMELRRYYNRMNFKDFAKLVELHLGKDIPQKAKDDFELCGLSNIDFFFSDWLDRFDDLEGYRYE